MDKQKAMLQDKEIFCAIPMEPHGWRGGADSKNHMIFTTHSNSEIAKLIDEMLTITGDVKGATNLMGSMAMTDVRVTQKLLSELNSRSLPFIDGRTTPNSKADSLAGVLGIPFATVDYPVDMPDPSYSMQSSKLYETALKSRTEKGVILSLRASKESLAMLKVHSSHLMRLGIEFVPASDLLEMR